MPEHGAPGGCAGWARGDLRRGGILPGIVEAVVGYGRGGGREVLALEELFFLMELARLGKASAGELAALVGLKASEASREAGRLAARGLVAEGRATESRRETVFALTEPGWRLLDSESSRLEGLLAPVREGRCCASHASPYPCDEALESPSPVCVVALERGPDGGPLDLLFVGCSAAFAKMFHRVGMMREAERLSLYAHGSFPAMLEACAKAVSTGESGTVRIFSESQLRPIAFELTPLGGDRLQARVVAEERPASGVGPLGKYAMRYKVFFDSGPIKLIVEPATARILEANATAQRFYGMSRAKLLASTLYDLSVGPARRVRDAIARVEASGSEIFHTKHRGADGAPRCLEVHSSKNRWGEMPVHFDTIFECSGRGASEAAGRARDMAPPPAGDRAMDFSPFLRRYGGEIPRIGGMLESLSTYGRPMAYRCGEHFLEFGGIRPSLGFILEGMFRQYAITEDGRDCTVALLRPGQVINLSALLAAGGEEIYAFESRGASLVFVVDLNYLRPLVNCDPQWYKLLYHIQGEDLAAMRRRELSLLSDDATARFRRFLRDDPDAASELLGYQIASYLGISSETLSRIRRKLRTRAERRQPRN